MQKESKITSVNENNEHHSQNVNSQMSCFDSYNFEIKESRTQKYIPVIEGVHLHSSYNPEKEAKTFVEKYRDEGLKKSSNVLVLGMGFGYHLKALYDIGCRLHENFNIQVIEPNKTTYNEFQKHKPVNLENTNIQFFVGVEIEELFHNISFVNFLVDKPLVIAHPASFNLYGEYFRKFLSYRSSNHIGHYKNHIQSNRLREYLFENTAQDSNKTLNQFIGKYLQKRTPIKDENDLFFLFLSELEKTGSSKSEGA